MDGKIQVLLLTPFDDFLVRFYTQALENFGNSVPLVLNILRTTKQPAILIAELAEAVDLADVVIAVLDGGRPNVMFEIGFVRALGVSPICLTQNENPVSAFFTSDLVVCHNGDSVKLLNGLASLVPLAVQSRRAQRQERFDGNQFSGSDSAELIEVLARTVHQRWVELRVMHGWSYDKQRDDLKLTHPGLVQYDELSFAEQEYDRQTALATLKAITALGYSVKIDDHNKDLTDVGVKISDWPIRNPVIGK
jgi:RyR domain